jgi:vitamin B12 transporter
MNKRYLPLTALMLGSSTLIHAADETLSPIMVTATRTAQSADETLAPVTVISKEEIQRSQAGNLTELLAGTVGMDITETGWYGQSSNYYIRGTSSKHILVLVDGVQLGSATTGSADLVEIGLSHIERIEIVRGPRSSLYGSSAIGGVIQIFTTQDKKKERANIDISYGSHNTKSVDAGVSGGDENTQIQVGLSHLNTDGADVSNNTDPADDDKDGYEVDRASINLQHKLTERARIDLAAYQSVSTTEYDGYTKSSVYTKETVQRTLSAGVDLNLLSNWDMKLRASSSSGESDNYQDATLSGIFHTQRQQYTWQNDVALSDSALLTIGMDNTHETIDSQTTYTETERTVTGGFAELQKSYQRQNVLLSLRSDDFGELGQHTTGNIDYGYAISDTLRLTAGYGTAFKAPTFNGLYYPSMPWGEGNPDLAPESSTSYELGLRGTLRTGSWFLGTFRTEIDDMIEWQCSANCTDADPYNDVYKPFNLSSVQITGIEANIKQRFGSYDINASLTLLDPKDLESGNKLQNRADASLRVDLGKKSGKWHNSLSLLAQSARYADSDNTRELDAYVTVDLRTQYELSEKWRIKGKVRNLFDEEYQTTDTTYQPAGRAYLVTIGYNL